jgi:hypothetical protein
LTSIALGIDEEAKRSAYKVAWTMGHKLGLAMAWWRLQGNVKVHGLNRALDALAQGNCVITWNHSCVPDNFWLNGLFYRPFSSRSYLYNDRFFIYSMPDRRILDACHMTEEQAKKLRCIIVDRSDIKVGQRGLIEARKVLRAGKNVSAQGEEGRTHGLSNEGKQLFWNEAHDRCIREISDSVLLIANKATTYIPAYLKAPLVEDMPRDWGLSYSEPMRRIRGQAGKQYLPFEFFFGESFRLSTEFKYSDKIARKRVLLDMQERILHA